MIYISDSLISFVYTFRRVSRDYFSGGIDRDRGVNDTSRTSDIYYILESLSSAIKSLPNALNKSTTKSFSAIVKSNLPPSPSTSTLLNPTIIHSCASK